MYLCLNVTGRFSPNRFAKMLKGDPLSLTLNPFDMISSAVPHGHLTLYAAMDLMVSADRNGFPKICSQGKRSCLAAERRVLGPTMLLLRIPDGFA